MHSQHAGRPSRPNRRAVLGTIAGVAAAGVAGGYAWNHLGHGGDDRVGTAADGTATGPSARPTGADSFERLSAPGRTVARAADGGTLATFTDGARTAVLTGPTRTFSEPRTTEAKVTTDAWVRVLPHSWQQGMEKSAWFKGWFRKALGDSSPDVFAVAFEYSSAGAPDKHKDGVRYAGTAHFGPRNDKVNNPLDFAYHDEQSDFYDYLGIPWSFPDGTRVQPEQARYGDVDCSGFQRLVWGYRMGIPLHNTNTRGTGLPRRAFAIAADGPGHLVIPHTGTQQPTDLRALQPGDLVFFAIIKDRPDFIDHCGMYMGLDDQGRHRFYSSRSAANGPTLGDMSGHSLLDGTDFYARGLRAARRL